MTTKNATPQTQRPAKVGQRAAKSAAARTAGDSVQRAALDSAGAQPAAALALQRSVGNRATGHILQAKLTVGPAGDHYEQEADRVAGQVLHMAAPAEAQVQRAPEEEELQMKPLASAITPLVQREPEEDEVQMKPQIQRAAGGAGFEVGGDVESQLAATQGGGSPLPAEVRSFMEPRFGVDFSGVRVHTDSAAVQLSRDLSAQAFTLGQDIYLGEGKYSPGTDTGKQLLAHELTHVVQQTSPAPLGSQVQRSPAGTIQRVIFGDGKVMSGQVLAPMPVNSGTGTHSNLKWNKGGGASGKGKYNTGFWYVQSDPGLELHVHFSDAGGLVSGGGVAHHFKRGNTPKGSVTNADLQSIFGSTTVTAWTKATYTIP